MRPKEPTQSAVKPSACPFCGSSAQVIPAPGENSLREPHLPMVSCVSKACAARIEKVSIEFALAAWNKRRRI